MRLTGFEDRAAFVTGAAGGIGVALVRLLRASGAKVFATDRADALAAQSLPTDCGILWHALDVRDGAAVDAALAEAVRVFGPVAHGVHAAGVLSTQPVLASTDEDLQRVIDINAGGTFRVTRALGRHMAGQGKGSIVVIGSNAGGLSLIHI